MYVEHETARHQDPAGASSRFNILCVSMTEQQHSNSTNQCDATILHYRIATPGTRHTTHAQCPHGTHSAQQLRAAETALTTPPLQTNVHLNDHENRINNHPTCSDQQYNTPPRPSTQNTQKQQRCTLRSRCPTWLPRQLLVDHDRRIRV